MEMKNVEILLVEDNPGDVGLTKEAFSESKLKNTLIIVTDGVEATEYLHKEGKYSNATTPDLILLDLNLPKKDGREVLEDIKNDPDLKTIPVVVLTTSDADEDVVESYENHANCYIRKPVDFEKFIEVVQTIESFWFSIVRLPK